MGVQRPADQRLAGHDVVAVLNQHVGGRENQVLANFHIVPDDGDDVAVDLNAASDVGYHLFDGLAFTGLGCFDSIFGGLLDGGLGLLVLERGHAGGQDHPWLDGFALIHQDQAVLRGLVVLAEFFFTGDSEAAAFFVGLHLDHAVNVGQDGCSLGHARLKELLYPGKTAGDVQTGNTASVERPHGQLGAGLADALGGDDADGLSHLNE